MTEKIEISDKVKENIKVLAKRAGMSTDDLDNLMKTIVHEQKELGVPSDQLSDRVGRRMQATLKKKLKSSGRTTKVVGTILGKSFAIDRAKKHHNAAIEFIKKNGKVALEAGYINKKGQHLYKNDKYKAGKVVPEHEWESDSYAVVNIPDKDGNDDMRFADIKLKGKVALAGMAVDGVNDKGEEIVIEYPLLPQFQLVEMDVYVVSKKDENKFRLTLTKDPVLQEEGYVDFEPLIDPIKNAYPDRMLKSLTSIEDFYDAHVNTEDSDDRIWNPWLMVKGDVVSVSTNDYGWVVNISDDDMMEEDETDIGIFFNDSIDIDLTDSAMQGFFMVRPYTHKDTGEMRLAGMSYWVPEMDRAKKGNVEETPEADDTWGMGK